LRLKSSYLININNAIDFVRRTIVSAFPLTALGVNVLFSFDREATP